MILMDGQSLTPKAPLYPETQSMQLGERDSQSTFTVGPDAPEITVGDWIMEDSWPGLGITWRVRGVDTSYNDETRTVHLEHVIQTLKDTVMFGDVTAAMMGGGDTVGALQAIQYVLARQGVWQLGAFGYDLSAPFEFNSSTLFDALEDICSALADCVWTYETTRLPFTLNIMPQDSAVKCEMRGGRNLSTLQKSIDRSRMYTRIYPVGADDLHISGEYLEANTQLYGVICKVETDQAYDTDEKLRMWAADRLRRHCEPSVTITINGMELSAETGEPLDKLVVGTVCRVPVPELGVVMAEKITRLNYKDVIRDSTDVTVTLANNKEDVATLFKQEKQTSEKAGRSAAKGGKKLDNKIEDTAEGLISVFQRTAGEIYAKVESTRDNLQASIDVQKNRIDLVVEGTGDNAKIKPAAITAAIVDKDGYLSSVIKISGSQIKLDGNTSINDILRVSGNVVTIDRLLHVNGTVRADSLMLIAPNGSRSTLNPLDLSNMPRQVWIDESTNTLKIKQPTGRIDTFKKATSISGSWSGSSSGTTATFTYEADDSSIAAQTTSVTLHAGSGRAYITDPNGYTRASIAVSSGDSYTRFGYFDYWGTVSQEGRTRYAYVCDKYDQSILNEAFYTRN